MDESDQLASEVDALSARVEDLERELEARDAGRHALGRLLSTARRRRLSLSPDEGLLGGEAAATAWRLIVAVVGWVLIISGAWGLDQSLGSGAIVGALAFLIYEAVG
jgi:hypothetical protein